MQGDEVVEPVKRGEIVDLIGGDVFYRTAPMPTRLGCGFKPDPYNKQVLVAGGCVVHYAHCRSAASKKRPKAGG